MRDKTEPRSSLGAHVTAVSQPTAPVERFLTRRIIATWILVLAVSVSVPLILHLIAIAWPMAASILLMDSAGMTFAGVSLVTVTWGLFATLGATSTVRLAISQHAQRQQQLEAEQASRDFIEYREWAKELTAGNVREAAWAQLAALTDRHHNLRPGTTRLAEKELSRCLMKSSMNAVTNETEPIDEARARAEQAWGVLRAIGAEAPIAIKLHGKWLTPFNFDRQTQSSVVLDLSEVDATYTGSSTMELIKDACPPRQVDHPARLVLRPLRAARVSQIVTYSQLVFDMRDYGGLHFSATGVILDGEGSVELLRGASNIELGVELRDGLTSHAPLHLPGTATDSKLDIEVTASDAQIIPIATRLENSTLDLSAIKPPEAHRFTFDLSGSSVLDGSSLKLVDRIGSRAEAAGPDTQRVADFTPPPLEGRSKMTLQFTVDAYWDEIMIHNLTCLGGRQPEAQSVKILVERSGELRPLKVTLDNANLEDVTVSIEGKSVPALDVQWTASRVKPGSSAIILVLNPSGVVSFAVENEKESRLTDQLTATFAGTWSVRS